MPCSCVGAPLAHSASVTIPSVAPRAAAAAEAEDGSSSGRSLRDVLLEEQRGSGCAPILQLVAAVAAAELRTSLELDGARRAVEDGIARLEVMEVKTSLKGTMGLPSCLPCHRC